MALLSILVENSQQQFCSKSARNCQKRNFSWAKCKTLQVSQHQNSCIFVRTALNPNTLCILSSQWLAKAEKLTFLWTLTRKSGTSGTSRFCHTESPDLFQAPCRRVFLLCGYNLRSHKKFQAARTPRRRSWLTFVNFTTYISDRNTHRVNFGAIGG